MQCCSPDGITHNNNIVKEKLLSNAAARHTSTLVYLEYLESVIKLSNIPRAIIKILIANLFTS